MYYVTDTHSLVWYLAEDKRLGPKAFRVFNDAESKKDAIIVIPTIIDIIASKIVETIW